MQQCSVPCSHAVINCALAVTIHRAPSSQGSYDARKRIKIKKRWKVQEGGGSSRTALFKPLKNPTSLILGSWSCCCCCLYRSTLLCNFYLFLVKLRRVKYRRLSIGEVFRDTAAYRIFRCLIRDISGMWESTRLWLFPEISIFLVNSFK